MLVETKNYDSAGTRRPLATHNIEVLFVTTVVRTGTELTLFPQIAYF